MKTTHDIILLLLDVDYYKKHTETFWKEITELQCSIHRFLEVK